MKDLLWVGLGGFLGANARYLVGGWIAERLGVAFPYGTFAINVSGSFVLGVLMGALEGHVLSPAVRLSVAIGFVGAYTTFSTFTFETLRLIEDGSVLFGIVNVTASVLAGMLAVVAGVAAGRAL